MTKKKTALSRDQILAVDDLKTVPVDVPEWGGTVYVRMMTGVERDLWEAMTVDENGDALPPQRKLANLRGRLVVTTASDAAGERLFEDTDAELVGKKSAAALDRVFAASSRLNRIFEADIEELLGNLDGARNGSST